MRRSWTLFAGLLSFFALAGPAGAAPTAFTGTLSVALGANTTFDPIATVTLVASGTADVTFSGGSIAAFSLAGGTFSTSVTIPITDPAVSPISQLVADVTNGAGSFGSVPGGSIPFVGSGFSGSGSGTMALGGHARIGVLGPPPLANITVPFTSGGVDGIGLGGAPIIAFSPTAGATVTVLGAPWTTGLASIGSVDQSGFVAGNTLQLVSPTYISTDLADTPFLAFSLLTLTFAPEPGTLLIVSGGLAALGLISRRARGARGRAAGSRAAAPAGCGSGRACSAGSR